MAPFRKTKKVRTPPQQHRAMLDLKSRCVHCGKPLFKADEPEPKVRFETNAIGEDIAWCACASCHKVSPVRLNETDF